MTYHPNILNAAVPYPKDWWKRHENVFNSPVNLHWLDLELVSPANAYFRYKLDKDTGIPLVLTFKKNPSAPETWNLCLLYVPANTVQFMDLRIDTDFYKKPHEDFYTIINENTAGFTSNSLKTLWKYTFHTVRTSFEDEGFDINKAIYPAWLD